MRRGFPTMADLFRKGGYATGIFGKWHLGHDYPDRPMDRGFDKAIWFKGWGLQSEIEFDNDYVNPRYLDGTETKRASAYCTDFWFQEAMTWMTQQKDKGKPFFAYIPTNAAHMPLWPPEKYADNIKTSSLRELADPAAVTGPSRLNRRENIASNCADGLFTPISPSARKARELPSTAGS
jgi:arylsulfatase A-like enzyme